MDSIATTSTGPVHFLNLEYFFRLLYDALTHGGTGAAGYGIFFANIWNLYSVLAYIATFFFLIVLAYATIQLEEVKAKEHHEYETVPPALAETNTEHSRWKHIQTLIESMNENDWRQAIIEADIMLDDILNLHGYIGESVGEKLKQGDPSRFHTLEDAWEAHKMRNDIAHQGLAQPLSGQMAYRTITRYKNVFEEFHAI